MKVFKGLFLAALAAAVLPAAARADKVDVRLNEEMPKIMEYLRGKNYQNIGVLRFQVQKGKASPRFDNAPYNATCPSVWKTCSSCTAAPAKIRRWA